MKRWIGWTTAAILVSLASCGKNGEQHNKKQPAAAAPKKDNAGKSIPAQPVARDKTPKLLPFKDAVVLDPVPEDELQPPDMTYTGKNAVKIFESIANDLWDKATFTDNQGRAIRYQAILATDLGEIHTDLHGNLTPNHVRSFVCLARSGYYDGMGFYLSVDRSVEGNRAAYIEAGCPRGTGAYGSGSIGYWLRPEISSKLTLEEGVLVACQNRDPNSAACRFFITAAAMPQMDGQFTVFGKVRRGLDIVHTINKKAVLEGDRLEQPVIIRSVTIQTVSD
jgi:cyclophilin family peptidyl-prolyl cis-trans isomerase